jgi:transcription antitermination factor NusG
MSQPELQPLSSNGGACWHVAQTERFAERAAVEQLAARGFTAYLPTCTVLRRDRANRASMRPVEIPLWSRYLLARFAPDDPWGEIQRTPGVARLLMSEPGKPGCVPAGLVEALQATEASRRAVLPPGTPWRPGDPCRLVGAAFAGADAVVIEAGPLWATVALVCFGALRQVHLARDLIAPRVSLRDTCRKI